MNLPWPKQPQTNTAEQRLDGCCFQHALQSFVSASRPLWPPSIGLDSQRTLLSDKLCILFPKDRLAHLAMTPKKVDLGFKGNMSFHFEPNFFHLRFAASMAQRKPKQLSFGQFGQFSRKAEAAFPCAWPMLDPQHTRNKNFLH